jgi:signal transduction histidine kinase
MRLRLFAAFAIIVLVAVISLVIIARQGAASAVRTFMFRGSMIGVDELASSLEDYYATNGSWLGIEAASLWPNAARGQAQGHGMQTGQGMAASMMGQRIRLAEADGYLVADTASPGLNGTISTTRLSSSEKENATPLEVDNLLVGYLLPEGGMRFNQGDETFLVSRISNAALIAGLIAGALALLLASVLAYRLLRPVRDLTFAAERMASGDLSQRVTIHGKDELATLGIAFNQMADALQQAEESRRAMTADIAHELRNPLAVQRANLEALQDGVYPLTADNLSPILEQNQLLTRLVNDLRTLALADSGQLDLILTPTDLVKLVPRVVERFTPQATTRGIRIDLDIPSNLPEISLDSQRVEQIINNLLSNALRHTPDGGRIQIELAVTSQQVSLRVQDSGPGIPEQAMPYIFDRFYRADKSRARLEGGTGLGLAIARKIAEAHGGTLTAGNHPQGGAEFVLTLPINP